ncbi:MAG: hypothetical protein GX118_07180 [Arcobacter butzleri]|nr:hypothetical protein [Arcobacteraceae bacterium]MDY0365689.1 hypothetical protein [Arcobacteraceae bacterium]NLO17956.1 hypothetical protein [Aliarcobacter butzleri]
MFSGLSLDQAPPIKVVFSFFITAAIFGLFGSLNILLFDYNYIFFHLLTIGFFSFVMIGALFQMFPVMIGVGVKFLIPTFRIVYFSLFFGLLFFYLSYFFTNTILIKISTLLLLIGFLTFIVDFLYSLFSSSIKYDATSISMAIALLFFAFGIVFGIGLLLGYYGITSFNIAYTTHLNTIFFGAIFILVMGISFKIIPMFWVAKEYPNYCRYFILPLISSLVLLYIVLELFGFTTSKELFGALFALPLMAFYSITFRRLRNRKRKLKDYSIYFINTGLILGFIGACLLIAQNFIGIKKELFFTLFGLGCASSYIFGLLYKIVPFLCWFHLSSKGLFDIPTIKEFIEEKYIKAHFIVHIFALIVSIFSIKLLAFTLIVSFALMAYNITKAYKTYLRISKQMIS